MYINAFFKNNSQNISKHRGWLQDSTKQSLVLPTLLRSSLPTFRRSSSTAFRWFDNFSLSDWSLTFSLFCCSTWHSQGKYEAGHTRMDHSRCSKLFFSHKKLVKTLHGQFGLFLQLAKSIQDCLRVDGQNPAPVGMIRNTAIDVILCDIQTSKYMSYFSLLTGFCPSTEPHTQCCHQNLCTSSFAFCKRSSISGRTKLCSLSAFRWTCPRVIGVIP